MFKEEVFETGFAVGGNDLDAHSIHFNTTHSPHRRIATPDRNRPAAQINNAGIKPDNLEISGPASEPSKIAAFNPTLYQARQAGRDPSGDFSSRKL